jgi:hypothetical protein
VNPRPEDLDALARAIDRVVFGEAAGALDEAPVASGVISYLNESFPSVQLSAGRRDRLQRRLMHSLGIPTTPLPAGWLRLEEGISRRLGSLDHRWTPMVGGAALVLLGVVGFAFWRQRGAGKPAIASIR